MKANSAVSDFYCTKCGKQGIPVIRRNGKYKEPGHLKKMYCIYCGEQRNMVEIKPAGKYTVEIFKIEFEKHNFTKDGQRITPWKMFIGDLKSKGEI